MVVFRIIHNTVTLQYKIVRGMVAYAILWPTGSIIEQTLVEKRNFSNYDWAKAVRMSIYGGLFNGPTLYIWIRMAARMWPSSSLKASISKAITEQFAYDPFAISFFLYGMTLFEGRSKQEAEKELREKFLPTYKVGFIFWPIVQTINFTFVPVRNQVIVAGFFSLIWTTFLSWAKSRNVEEKTEAVKA